MGKVVETKSLRQLRSALRLGANIVPLARELPADTLTPVAAFLRLSRAAEPAFLLESVEGGERSARWSFAGIRPFETLEARGGAARWRAPHGEGALPGSPFRALGERLERYRALPEPGLPPCIGGAVGHVGYEMTRHLEPTLRLPLDAEPEARLLLFGAVAAFDRLRHRVLLIANALADGREPLARAWRRAGDALDELQERLARPSAAERPLAPARAPAAPPEARARLGARGFLAGVASLKRAIRAGEIFQAVLSDRFELPLRAHPFTVYRRLRALNPSPYMFYIGAGREALLGASPEMLVQVRDGALETRPIAGTRPRGADEEGDRRRERELLASVKERAEHVMLVDLGRNDLGRVAAPGSVSVPALMQVERYSHVMHLVSSVRARLARRRRPWDALAACFPAGTVTGAPKLRAMQLVADIERAPRGLYAGAVVYRDFRGNLDSCIAIRSLTVRGGRAYAQAGAGIVADSRPEAELREIRAKAGAMLEAVRQAEGAA